MSLDLYTHRLHLRRLLPSDFAEFLSYRADPEVTRYQGFDVMNDQQALHFIQENLGLNYGTPGQWVQYAIALRDTDVLIGDCALHRQAQDPTTAEIGITLSPRAQHAGYAQEAMEALLSFLFEQYDMRRVVGITDVQNTASARLLERVGFRREGHLIENFFSKGRWSSEYHYAMLRREWLAKQQAAG